MTMRKKGVAGLLSLPILAICGFLVATVFAGVSVAGDTTSTSTTTTTTTTTTPTGGEGCTPGFWKNRADPEDFPAPYTPTTTLGSVFDVPAEYESMTFDEALGLRGGGLDALLRHAVAALLNAASADVDYPLTTAQVIQMTNAAIASGDYEETKDIFDEFNNLTAPGSCD